MHKRLVTVAFAVIVAAVAATTSSATAPGKNGRIAFRRYFDKNQTQGAIFTVKENGSGLRQLTHPAKLVVDDQPDWSKDGSALVFASNRDKIGRPANSIYNAIFSMRADGSGLTRLSPECPSPDKVTGCPFDFQPSISPDGKRVLYTSGQGQIYVVGSKGEGRHVLLKATTPDTSHTGYTVTDPQFAPDGKRFLYVRENRGNLQPKNGQAIFVTSIGGGSGRQMTPWSLHAGDNPDWSPDGKWILFHSNANSDQQAQIYVTRSDGSALKQLTHFKNGTIVTSSSFSPDGKWIVFGSTGAGGQADLFVMRSDGTGMHRITYTRLWESSPDWGSAR